MLHEISFVMQRDWHCTHPWACQLVAEVSEAGRTRCVYIPGWEGSGRISIGAGEKNGRSVGKNVKKG